MQLVIGLTIASMRGDTGDVDINRYSQWLKCIETNNLKRVLQIVFVVKPFTVSISEFLVMQGLTSDQAELLKNLMIVAEEALFKTRMELGVE